MFTQEELSLIQGTDARGYIEFLTVVWNSYPGLKLDAISEMATKLWKARKEWLKCLEPTIETIENASFEVDIESQCGACKGDAMVVEEHMSEGGCLYTFAVDTGLIEPFESHGYPPLPASPESEPYESESE